MGTSALFVFITDLTKDLANKFLVYKHCDGHPETVAEYLYRASKLAWELPRFEADEFAASFVSAIKVGPGDICIVADYNYFIDENPDYVYEIRASKHKPYIEVKALSGRKKLVSVSRNINAQLANMMDNSPTIYRDEKGRVFLKPIKRS